MSYVDRIQCGIDYIERHLDEEITPAQVAAAAGISQWHFQRIFKALTQETLKTYIRCRRMSNSLDRLISTDARIIDIALDAGYETQESFTRAFKQMFDMTPNAFRRLGENGLFLRKLQLDAGYLNHMAQSPPLVPDIVSMDSRRLVGMRTRFFGPESEKNNMGAKLPSLWSALLDRVEEIPHLIPGTGYGIVNQAWDQPELLEYHAAFGVSAIGEPPAGMDRIDLPGAEYAVFAHRGHPEALDHTVSYIYANWLLHSGRRHSYAGDLEIYGSDYVPASPDSVIHYAIPLATP